MKCGGQGWTGPTQCVAGTICVQENAYFSNCFAPNDIPSNLRTTATPTPTPTVVPVAAYGQVRTHFFLFKILKTHDPFVSGLKCGGIGYTGTTVCVAGTTCVDLNPYFLQCAPSS